VVFGWRSKRSTSESSTAAPGLRSISRIDLGNGATVHVGVHQLDAGDQQISCWTYVTQGLRSHGQKEIIIALRQSAGEAPKGPVMFLGLVARLAAQGQLVNVGGFTQFGPNSPKALGQQGKLQVHGVGYAKPHGMDHVVSPMAATASDFLAVVQLAQTELESTQRFGLARTLAQLGKQVRFYPYPLWNDPDRAETMAPDWIKGSTLSHFGGFVSVQGLMPFSERGGVVLQLAGAGTDKLIEALSSCTQRKVGLLAPTTQGWSEVSACLAWRPGLREPQAITPSVSTDMVSPFNAPGQRCLGCFIAVVGGVSDEGAMMLEDGFSVFLHAETMPRFIQAVTERTAFSIPGNGKFMPFSLRVES
jgi:hypothetical protein